MVECTPRDQDVTGSRPARCLAHISLLSSAFFKKPLEAVQYYGFSIKDAFMDVHRISKKSFVILRLFGGIARGFDRSAVVTVVAVVYSTHLTIERFESCQEVGLFSSYLPSFVAQSRQPWLRGGA